MQAWVVSNTPVQLAWLSEADALMHLGQSVVADLQQVAAEQPQWLRQRLEGCTAARGGMKHTMHAMAYVSHDET